MKLSFDTVVLVHISFLASTGLGGAQNAGHIVVQTGDVLANGWEVADFSDSIAMSEAGAWAALVHTTEPSSSRDSVVLVDGQIVLAEGDTLANGDVVEFLTGMDLDRDGTLALAYRYAPASGSAVHSRLSIGSTFTLDSGALVGAPGVPASATYRRFDHVAVALPYAVVAATVGVPGSVDVEAAFLLDFTNGGLAGSPGVSLLAAEGSSPAALAGPITWIGQRPAVASDGTYAVSVAFDDAGTFRHAVATSGGVIAVPGTGSPAASGHPWTGLFGITVAAAPGGIRAVSATVGTPQTTIGLLVSTAGGVLAEESQLLAARPTEIVYSFDNTSLELSDSGEAAFIVRLGGGKVLVYGDDVVLESGVSLVSGQLVTDMFVASPTLAIGRSGEALLAVVQHAGGETALVTIERMVGNTTSCVVRPNSTGQMGRLVGSGSSYVAENDVRLRASRLPQMAFGYLLTSRTAGFSALPGGSSGNLCLGGAIGRFVGQIQSSGAQGQIETVVDLTALPQPLGAVAAQPGETWYFQLWHRDSSPGGPPTSNFTASLAIDLR
ncbi:hypothetical protein [Planctomycetes bacterium Poly30]